MPNLIIALAIAFGGIYLVRYLARTSPAQIPGFTRKVAGGACVALAGFLALRGAMQAATALFVFGLGLLGSAAIQSGFPWTRKTPGQRSRVATSILAMELDHDTGRMEGEVLVGTLRGRALSSLSDSELAVLREQCAAATDQSLALLDAWIDRVKPGWRAGNAGGSAAQPGTTKMSREEAFAVLGLKPGAKPNEIRDAHRRLMKQFHPDRGGSDYLAAKINQAKDILLGT
jgi:hypothetical protein